jgi:outer membrane protein TolC
MMIGKLRRYVIRKRFQAMVRTFDEAIEAARKAHQPTRHLIQAKADYVRARLAGEKPA